MWSAIAWGLAGTGCSISTLKVCSHSPINGTSSARPARRSPCGIGTSTSAPSSLRRIVRSRSMTSPVMAAHAAATARADSAGPETPGGRRPSDIARFTAASASAGAAAEGSADTSRLCGGVQFAAPTTAAPSVTHQKLGALLYVRGAARTMSMIVSSTLRAQGSALRNVSAAAAYSSTSPVVCTWITVRLCGSQSPRRPPVATCATTYTTHGTAARASSAPRA